jgi:hypothetical protein
VVPGIRQIVGIVPGSNDAALPLEANVLKKTGKQHKIITLQALLAICGGKTNAA